MRSFNCRHTKRACECAYVINVYRERNQRALLTSVAVALIENPVLLVSCFFP